MDFQSLQLHVYLSSPDDAEGELEEILRTGTTRYLQGFPWAYAYSKQLMERLMMAWFPDLPILLLRPTSIGPAIAQPYEMYGPRIMPYLHTLRPLDAASRRKECLVCTNPWS